VQELHSVKSQNSKPEDSFDSNLAAQCIPKTQTTTFKCFFSTAWQSQLKIILSIAKNVIFKMSHHLGLPAVLKICPAKEFLDIELQEKTCLVSGRKVF